MKSIFLIIALLMTSVALSECNTLMLQAANGDTSEKSLWEQYKIDFNKQYETKEEELKRFSYFSDNVKLMNEFNNQRGKLLLGITSFSDLSPSERPKRQAAMRQILQKTSKPFVAQKVETLRNINAGTPVVITDIRKNGTISSVKDQGNCGGCYVFSALAVLESAWIKNGNSEVSFSPQDVLDCCHTSGCDGCDGGLPADAYEHIKSKGVSKDSSYSYHETQGSYCKWVDRIAKAKDISSIDLTSRAELLSHLDNVGPVSVAMYASGTLFQQWKPSGSTIEVIDSTICGQCANHLTVSCEDHAVTIVGYGYSGAQIASNLFFIVKNSWGTSWGYEGYFYAMANSCYLNSRDFDYANVEKYDSGYWATIIAISVSVSVVFLIVVIVVIIVKVKKAKSKKNKNSMQSVPQDYHSSASGQHKLGSVSSNYN